MKKINTILIGASLLFTNMVFADLDIHFVKTEGYRKVYLEDGSKYSHKFFSEFSYSALLSIKVITEKKTVEHKIQKPYDKTTYETLKKNIKYNDTLFVGSSDSHVTVHGITAADIKQVSVLYQHRDRHGNEIIKWYDAKTSYAHAKNDLNGHATILNVGFSAEPYLTFSVASLGCVIL